MLKVVATGHVIGGVYTVHFFTDNPTHDNKFIKYIADSHNWKLCDGINVKTTKRKNYTFEFQNGYESEKCIKFLMKCHLYDKS